MRCRSGRKQPESDLDESVRRPLVAMRRADQGAISVAEWRPPGVAELVAQGVAPPEGLTGNLEIASGLAGSTPAFGA